MMESLQMAYFCHHSNLDNNLATFLILLGAPLVVKCIRTIYFRLTHLVFKISVPVFEHNNKKKCLWIFWLIRPFPHLQKICSHPLFCLVAGSYYPFFANDPLSPSHEGLKHSYQKLELSDGSIWKQRGWKQILNVNHFICATWGLPQLMNWSLKRCVLSLASTLLFFYISKLQKIQLLATTQLLSLQTQRLKSKVGFAD